MAKVAWKLSYKKTFDLKKLSKRIPKLVNKTIQDVGMASESSTVENLEKLRSPKLSNFTKKMRDKKIGWGGKKLTATKSGNQPLYQTGNLRENIKWNSSSKSLSMPYYGLIQHKGFTSQIKRRYMNYRYIDVPARNFISLPVSKIFSDHGANFIGVAKPLRRAQAKKLLKAFHERAGLYWETKATDWKRILR